MVLVMDGDRSLTSQSFLTALTGKPLACRVPVIPSEKAQPDGVRDDG